MPNAFVPWRTFCSSSRDLEIWPWSELIIMFMDPIQLQTPVPGVKNDIVEIPYENEII